MVSASKRAFVLPYALLLGSTILVLAVLFIQMGRHQVRRKETEIVRLQATNTLRLNVHPLILQLEETLAQMNPASALLPAPSDSPNSFHTILIDPESSKQQALASAQPEATEVAIFMTSHSAASLPADLISISPGNAASEVSLAWALQDLSLLPSDDPPPEFWPLPAWDYSTFEPIYSVSQFLDDATHGQWREGPWIPRGEPLPFQMESSPALVPVIEKLNLRVGIFASGPVRSREKIIRARFYLEGCLWNPYNRPFQVHYGSSLRSCFQLVFHNLPEVRIWNLDRGVSTAWIPLDDSNNSSSGKTGFHGWIRLPPSIEPGERYVFHEPDANWQPEGLARTLHPGFMVGPADHISMEFRESPGGMYVACVPLSETDPLNASMEGSGWFRIEGFPVVLPDFDFPRADEGDQPFYLSGGSLSFRHDNAQLNVACILNPEVMDGLADPRRRILNHEDGRFGPAGNWLQDRDLLSVRIDSLMNLEPEDLNPSDPEPRTPLFSWPENKPQSLLESSDLPQWSSGFRIGSPGADMLNKLLDNAWAWPIRDLSQDPIALVDRKGNEFLFRKSFSINMLSSNRWSAILTGNASGGFPLKHAAYPWIDPGIPSDFSEWTNSELDNFSLTLVDKIALGPSPSVHQFFSDGYLPISLDSFVTNNPLQYLLPFRGLLRNGPLPRPHGSAWLLHMAVRVNRDGLSIWRSAMVWLLKTGTGSDTQIQVIQFQWTHPEEHFKILNPQG